MVLYLNVFNNSIVSLKVNTSTREKASWLQKAEIFELPLNECKDIYAGINLQQLPENLLQSQLCASSVTKDGKILDACQGMKSIISFEVAAKMFFGCF